MTASGQARRWILLCLVMGGGLSPACAGADGFERLDRFFEKVDTFKASFIQVVLDENLLALEESSGLLWIARPGRFRWDYESVHPQTIVADGQVLWVYDIELEQVTRRGAGERDRTNSRSFVVQWATISERLRCKRFGGSGCRQLDFTNS